MNYSLYDQLAFLLPGAMILGAAVVGGWGWPWSQPGAGTVGALAGAAYLIGHVNVALARWLAPLYLGRRPGTTPPGTWGMFGESLAGDRDRIEAAMEALVPGVSLETQYAVAYTRLQQQELDAPLKQLNAQIGFYRNTATAVLMSLLILVGWQATGRSHLPVLVWGPLSAVALWAYAAGYRRFWGRFSRQVVRGILAAGTDGNPDWS